ncbi:hypothetical protein KZO01_12690 [Kurthia zopfii]|nr:hypothetical protein KZO01_12690 [Kurthia zopfii]
MKKTTARIKLNNGPAKIVIARFGNDFASKVRSYGAIIVSLPFSSITASLATL